MKTIQQHKSRRFRRFLRANEAVSALEYAILVGAVAVGTGAAITAFSGDVQDALNTIGATIETVDTGTPDASGGTSSP